MSVKRSALPYHRMYNGRDLGGYLEDLARLSMGDACGPSQMVCPTGLQRAGGGPSCIRLAVSQLHHWTVRRGMRVLVGWLDSSYDSREKGAEIEKGYYGSHTKTG